MQMLKILAPALALAALATGGSAGAQAQQPHPVTRAQVASQLDGAFSAADTNHDGFLSAAEMQGFINKEVEQLEASVRAQLQAQFKELDTNKDGQLSWAEFSAQLKGVHANETPAEIMAKLDTNHDGKLSPAEFRAQRLAQFDKVDLNHDGTVTPDEERRAHGGK
jgi:Ca2+-binding EF-hand superfamily protein